MAYQKLVGSPGTLIYPSAQIGEDYIVYKNVLMVPPESQIKSQVQSSTTTPPAPTRYYCETYNLRKIKFNAKP